MLAAAVARFVLFDLGLFNPAWRPQAVGGPPLVNLLAPAYLLPAAALALAAAAERGRAARLADAWKGLAVAGVISWPLLAVRQLFHGSILPNGGLPTAENLAYSAAGLLTALALLGWGTARRDPVTRVASLVLMLATVAKVFLADASALDGLARIASFLGLGVSLIGISWFYTRHVFGRGRAAPAPAATPPT
ncbi:MAG: hypothetical protein AVDCRST_MAG39-1996 [uncultured Sphingomonadaceae bacterium]|uniref:DUF2339 domain-containing protein n=1 Tax=uncultured Sphingomonadaceae bacterium TaxID=169976 RepID=A0A6J4T0V0_9SPHN|nr:MAG: hypothetical protein AVDCRST_MAG39-1996 [uncultured Sphingomonadaceae bacterium]